MRLFKTSEERNVYIAYIAVCLIWGSTYLAIRIGVKDLPPTLFAGIRFIIAGLVMLLYAMYKKMTLPTKKEIMKISIVGLLLLLGGNGSVVWAETQVNSGVASLIVATVPLFMAIIELFIPNRPRLLFRGWVGLGIGFLGVAFLALPHLNEGKGSIFGILLLLLGASLWALGSVYSKSFKTRASIIPNIAIQMLSGGIALTLLGTSLGEFSKIQFTTSGIFSLLYLILFGSILGYSSYVYILQKWPAAKAGTYAYVNPLVAVFLGAVVLNERLDITVVLSTIVILGGVLLVQTSKSKVK